MDEEKEVGTGEIDQLSMQINGHPRDLLQRFMARNHRPNEFTAATEEIELNLGLSLGGRFGVDPKDSKLLRSSSIAGFTTLVRDDDFPPPPSVSCHGVITRTCSLPTEIEEEQRKRKELQSLRRMEAKRKRSEKRNFRACKDRSSSLERNCVEDKRVEDENGLINMGLKAKVESNSLAKQQLQQQQQQQQQQQEYMVKNGLLNSSVAPAFGLPSWVTPVARAASLPHGFDGITNGKASFFTAAGAAGLRGFPTPSSQGSLGSQGSSSSGISEFDSRPAVQGSSSNCAEARSPASVQSLPEQNDQKAVPTPGTTIAENKNKLAGAEMENQSKRPKVIDGSVMRETGRNVMEDMPCVSTKGDGPNGRRIEGFLYKYRKGEEVRIVCVCHGSFLTPAEFVKHAGGGDVAHPLRHIIVNPSSTFL